MQVRLAFVLLRRSIWSAAFSFWSVRSIMLGNEKSGYRTVSLLCGSRFVFRHSHNLTWAHDSIYAFLTDHGYSHDIAADVAGWADLASVGEEYELDGAAIIIVD